MITGDNYFRLYRDPDARRKGLAFATLGEQSPDDLAWRAGTRFVSAPQTPIRCRLAARGETLLPDAFLSDRVPLLSERAVVALKAAGVDNLDLYDALVLDVAGAAIPQRYFGVNIVGRIAAVDRATSTWDPSTREPLLELRSLVVDLSVVSGVALFRLAENPSFIIVNNAVRAAIEAAGLKNLVALQLSDRRAY